MYFRHYSPHRGSKAADRSVSRPRRRESQPKEAQEEEEGLESVAPVVSLV